MPILLLFIVLSVVVAWFTVNKKGLPRKWDALVVYSCMLVFGVCMILVGVEVNTRFWPWGFAPLALGVADIMTLIYYLHFDRQEGKQF